MSQRITPATSAIHKKITLPGAKSMTYRALLLAALADGVSEISGIYLSDSVRIFVSALHQLGIVTQLDETARSCIIAGGNGKFPKKQTTIWCANSKITARFLLAACASTPGVFYFDGAALLRQKSLARTLNILCRQGAQVIPNDTYQLPFTLIGSDSLQGGDINLNRDINHQMLSALLMISPFARTPFSFNVPDPATQPSINMTCALMSEFGVLVHRYHQGQFNVPVPQRYQAKDLVIEPDLSLAVYFFAAAIITQGEITIQPFKAMTSKQVDLQFLLAIEQMGCKVHETSAGLVVKSCPELHGIDIDLNKFGATFLALAAIAPFAKSPMRINHTGNMRQSEKNKLMAIKIELTKLQIQVEAGDDWLKIFPSTPKGCALSSHHDAYVAMALAVIGLKTPGVSIDNIECINQRFPEFFTLWDELTKQVVIP